MAYVRVQNAAGRVFDGFAQAGGNDLFLKWQGGDFSIIGIDDEDEFDLKIINAEVSLDIHGENAVIAGIITQDQLNNMVSQREAAAAAASEAAEYNTFLRLKAKYEPA